MCIHFFFVGRRSLARVAVRWLRKRKDGHFYDEDPKRLEYLAHVPEWINQREKLWFDGCVPVCPCGCFCFFLGFIVHGMEQCSRTERLEVRCSPCNPPSARVKVGVRGLLLTEAVRQDFSLVMSVELSMHIPRGPRCVPRNYSA